MTTQQAVSRFGKDAAARLSSAAASGGPEDQLRGPFENLLQDLSALCGHQAGSVVAVGETALADLKTRPDYAITVRGALVGFVELKAPGKGGDPRRFLAGHDKAQWQRLQSLPNLMYGDGNEFSLWRNGERAAPVLRLNGDVQTAGAALSGGDKLLALVEAFLQWQPISPRTAKELAEVMARLCRLLREEVIEALARKAEAPTTLATDWRGLLFPEATDEQFADGFAQAVTFGLLTALARGISIGDDLHKVAEGLKDTTELLNVINVLGLLVDLEPQAAQLLERICSAPLISDADLKAAGAYFAEGHVPASTLAQQALAGF